MVLRYKNVEDSRPSFRLSVEIGDFGLERKANVLGHKGIHPFGLSVEK